MRKLVLFILMLVSIAQAFAQNTPMDENRLWSLERIGVEWVDESKNEAIVGLSKYSIKGNSGTRNLYTMNLETGKLEQLTDFKGSVSQVSPVPNSNKLGYMFKGQWYEFDPRNEKQIKLMNSSKKVSMFKYSPNGRYAFYTQEVKLDKNTKNIHPDLLKSNARIINDLNYRHWSEWNDESYSHLIIESYNNSRLYGEKIDVMKDQRVDVPTKPFGGAEDAIWSPDSKKIIYVCKKLTGQDYAKSTNTDLYEYDLSSRKTTNLTKENLGYDTHPAFSAKGDKMAWLRMATAGFESDKNNIFVMDYRSKKRINLTSSFSETVREFIWAKTEDKIYFVAPFKGSNQIFELDFTSGYSSASIKQLTSEDRNHSLVQDLDGRLLISIQDMNHATEIYGFADGKAEQVSHVNDAIYRETAMSKVEKRWIKTTDGKDMLTWVIYPPDFDPNKKYPTLLYCQGGPQSMVSQFYSFRWNFQLMAAKGYIVVAPNRCGLPGFGEEWNAEISKDWGGQAIQDYLSAIDAVSEEPYVDKTRLGAVGASYGGYSVYMLAGVHNKRFSTLISHCGLFNLESWYGTTEELFFANWDIGGPYWESENAEGYKAFSPHRYVQNWDTPLMVIHGGLDFRVPENQGMEAFQAAKLKGLNSRFLYFPEENHWVLSPQNGILWHREFFKWLDETL